MEERVYNIRQNYHILNSLFFNHDRNPAHHSAVHTALILLSLASEKGFHDDVEDTLLEKKLEIIGIDVLDHEGMVIAPGVLLQSLADNHIPPDMVITKVDTRFAYPLLVPVDKGSKELRVQASASQPSGDSPAVLYTVSFYATDLFGKPIQPIRSMKVTAFPKGISPDEIFDKYVKPDFEKLNERKKEAIYSLTHETYIPADDDECYWHSIQNQKSFRRNGGISQLELLAKIPRILSMMADKLENDPPGCYEASERDLTSFLEYAEKEKSYGRDDGKSVEERALELSKKMRETYGRQLTVFDPRTSLGIDQHFDITVALSGKIRRGRHLLISEAVTGKRDILLMDESKIIVSPLLTERVIRYLDKINYSVEELEKFRYKKSV